MWLHWLRSPIVVSEFAVPQSPDPPPPSPLKIRCGDPTTTTRHRVTRGRAAGRLTDRPGLAQPGPADRILRWCCTPAHTMLHHSIPVVILPMVFSESLFSALLVQLCYHCVRVIRAVHSARPAALRLSARHSDLRLE